MDFKQMMLCEEYQKVRGLGDRLELMKRVVDWESFRPLIARLFVNNEQVGGRPHTDELVIVRTLVLQHLYGLSDEELEFQMNDRLSFRNFVGFPDDVPDHSTIWKLRESLQKTGIYEQVWDDIQRQINAQGYTIKKGVIQDASFIEADLGRKRHHKEKKAKKEGKTIQYSPKQLAHMDQDGTFSIKHGQVHYGYKDHVKLDVDNHLIRDIEVTTASLHDAKINLVEQNDIAAFRDKGYFGTQVPEGVIDKTMMRDTRAKKINGGQQKRNFSISKVRAPGERPFAVIKRVFHGAHTLVKTLARVTIKEYFKAIGYNIYQLVTLQRKLIATALKKC